MIILIIYMIPAFMLEFFLGNITISFIAATLGYYGFIGFLFIFLKKGYIHFVTNALMIAGLIKAVEYFFIAEAFVFYIHIALAFFMAAAIHVRKYQLYLSFFLFNGLIFARIFYILPLIEAGLLSHQALHQSIQSIFGSVFITFTIHFLSGIIDREIEESIKLEKIASTDKLTGLANRRKLEDTFSKSGVIGKKVILVMDIDFFKKVNDDFGHKIGDEVLIRFAGILTSVLRESDSCYRWGGEEFVAVLRDISSDKASLIAERLRSQVESFDFALDRPLTVSIGLTVSRDDTEDLQSMLERADRAMYRAKQNGRNRVEKELA